MSATWIMGFALLSALARGVITVIDRYQMGYRKNSVITVNFLNNLLSMALVTLIFVGLLWHGGLGLTMTPWLLVRMVIYAGLVQAVAQGYSTIFKEVTIMESVLLSKVTDFVIPLALFATTFYFHWQSYLISVVSTLLVIGLVISYRQSESGKLALLVKNFWRIGPLLILQAAVSPLLVADLHTPYALVMFTILTIYFRFLFTAYGFVRQIKASGDFDLQLTPKVGWLYATRAVLTLLAQVAFTLATSSENSGVAWIFLNMTSLFSVVLAGFILKERVQAREIWVLLSVVALGVVGNLL